MLRVAILVAGLVLTPVPSLNQIAAFQRAKVYVCPMHPEVQSSVEGKCPKCEMDLVEEKQEEKPTEDADAYTCPMHPEIRTAEAGTCPKCKMTLVPTLPGISDEFDLRIQVEPDPPRVNQPVKLRFSVYNPKTGEQTKQFALMHDRFFHLFVVSQDMNHFQHIHPTLQKDGSFSVETVLPQDGHYAILTDFFPGEGTPQVLKSSLTTAGYKPDLFASTAKLKVDATLVQVAKGVEVAPDKAELLGVDLLKTTNGRTNPMKIELSLEPGEIIAGKQSWLRYRLTDSVTGEPVTDIRPYLSAWGHTLMLSEDQADYVHSHPEQEVPDFEDGTEPRGGPEITFEALFPKPGVYRVWTQFLRGNTVTTVRSTIRVHRLGSTGY